MLLTHDINRFREAARHLWNTYLIRDADWDSVGAFREICAMLFEEQILRLKKFEASPIPVDGSDNPLTEYLLFAPHSGKLPLMVNREIPACGYWDFPVEWIPPEEHPEIRPIAFFDFNLLGMRILGYRGRGRW